jgi:hypothetical protein
MFGGEERVNLPAIDVEENFEKMKIKKAGMWRDRRTKLFSTFKVLRDSGLYSGK